MMSFGLMFVTSILAALLSSMSVWADKLSDVRLSMNDFYMAFLMTGWMFFFDGFFTGVRFHILTGVFLISISFVLIRTQLFVTPRQYTLGMIPHHSMAILMSRRLIEKFGENILGGLPLAILQNQENEIRLLKSF